MSKIHRSDEAAALLTVAALVVLDWTLGRLLKRQAYAADFRLWSEEMRT